MSAWMSCGNMLPNGANPKAICITHLARIDNESEFAQPIVKDRKIETGVSGKAEGGDDVALVFGREVGIKAEIRHAVLQCLTVGRVSRSS